MSALKLSNNPFRALSHVNTFQMHKSPISVTKLAVHYTYLEVLFEYQIPIATQFGKFAIEFLQKSLIIWDSISNILLISKHREVGP